MSVSCARFYISFHSIKHVIKLKKNDNRRIEEPHPCSNLFYRSCRDEFSGTTKCFCLRFVKLSPKLQRNPVSKKIKTKKVL